MAGKFYRSIRAGESFPVRLQDIVQHLADDVLIAENLVEVANGEPGPSILITEKPDEGSDTRGLVKERSVIVRNR